MRKLLNEELNRLSVDEVKKSAKNPLVIVLDNVRSMNNVGSAFRTADAFLCQKIVLCGITAQPPHREIHRAALGATETVDWEYEENILSALSKLKAEGYTIISVEQADESISLEKYSPKSSEKVAFVFGNEIYGVDEEVVQQSDEVVEIPQFGSKHSLNISVSIGIVLWDILSKTKLQH
jgi:tRNA G18 (ribose-2'-O)-methylase SpoU